MPRLAFAAGQLGRQRTGLLPQRESFRTRSRRVPILKSAGTRGSRCASFIARPVKGIMLRPDTLALTAVLALLTAVAPLSVDMYLPSLPDIGRELNSFPAQVQLTISFYLVGFALGQIVYGPRSIGYRQYRPRLPGTCLSRRNEQTTHLVSRRTRYG
jgi:hypothetical protein